LWRQTYGVLSINIATIKKQGSSLIIMDATRETFVGLITCDNLEYKVPVQFARRMLIVRDMLDDLGCNDTQSIPIAGIHSTTFKLILELLHLTNECHINEQTRQNRCTEYFTRLTDNQLKSVTNALNYLQLEDLLMTTCLYLRDLIDQSPQERVNQLLQ
jgi:hypothetical protein